MSDPDQLTVEAAVVLQHVRQNRELAVIYGLAQPFVNMVKQRLADQLDPWLKDCETVSAVPVRNFALSLRQD